MDVSTIKDFIFDSEIYPLVNLNPTPSPHAYYLGISNVFSLLLNNLLTVCKQNDGKSPHLEQGFTLTGALIYSCTENTKHFNTVISLCLYYIELGLLWS